MKRAQLVLITMVCILITTYFLFTSVVYLKSLNDGNFGVALNLFGGSNDGFFYWNQAINIFNGQTAVITSVYPLVIGYLFKITGSIDPYQIRILNLFGFILLLLSSIYLIKIIMNNETLYAYNKKIAYMLLILFFLFYASLQMNVNLSINRDVWIYAFYILTLIFSIKLIFDKKNRLISLVLMSIFLIILGLFRDYAMLSFLTAMILYFILIRIKNVKLFVFISMIFFAIYYTLMMYYKVPIIEMSLNDALNYRYRSLEENAGGSQVWINLNQPSFLLFLFNYVHSFFGNLIGPLPWHISNISTLFVFFIESIPMSVFIFYLFKNKKKLNSFHKYAIFHALIWICFIALTNDNLGTSTRLRPITWILIFIVFACVYANKRSIKT